jgi:5-methylcytosine-specific restriction enzyme subunit McrC
MTCLEELRGGLRVRTTSWVGVLRLQAVELRILPKLPGTTLDLVRMLEFATGLPGLRSSVGDWEIDAAGRHLLELFALLLAGAGERLIRAGLLADYEEREELLPVVRGRLLADRQVLSRFGRVDRIWCRFDEHEQNTPENQLVGAALRVCSRYVTNVALRSRVQRLRVLFDEICDPEDVTRDVLADDIVYDRLNEHYREAHELARLLIRGTGAHDLHQKGGTAMFAFLLDMNALFEAFVTRWLGEALRRRAYEVTAQRGEGSVIRRLPSGRSYRRVRPDLLVRDTAAPARRLPVDAKYKRYDEGKVGMADLYQCFLYAYAYGSQGPGVALSGSATPAAMLVYPTAGDRTLSERLEVQSLQGTRGAEIDVLGIPVRRVLDEMIGNDAQEVTEFVVGRINARFQRPTSP